MKKLIPILTALFFLAGCVKENYDNPPVGGKDPDLVANVTLDTVKARYTGTPAQITEDWIVKVLVVGDDKEGNLYQMLAVEDSTAGIAIKLDRSSLYTDYPVGRRLFIKLKGLWIGDYAGVIQIGGYLNSTGDVDNIPSAAFDKHIFKGVYGLPVVPHAVSISQLDESFQNRLIELNGVEFQNADAGKNYADGYNKVSVNRTLKDCNGGTIIVRTSGYASFANTPTATGNGKLLAIYSSYNGDAQLLIRTLNDVKLDTARCGGTIVGGDGLLGIRALYGGSDLTLPSGKIVEGVVISDAANLNTDPKNMVIQDSTGGIVIRFTATHSFVLGDKVRVDLSGLTLSDYNGLVQVINVPASAATKIGTGTITPRVATVAQIQTNSNAWESTLVTVQNATISGAGSTWSGTTQINDGTGIINHFTRSAASFSGVSLPSGNKSYTAIVSNFNGVQLNIRNTSDVQ